jgi:hypothetical protein
LSLIYAFVIAYNIEAWLHQSYSKNFIFKGTWFDNLQDRAHSVLHSLAFNWHSFLHDFDVKLTLNISWSNGFCVIRRCHELDLLIFDKKQTHFIKKLSWNRNLRTFVNELRINFGSSKNANYEPEYFFLNHGWIMYSWSWDRIFPGRRVGIFDPERRSGRCRPDPTWKSSRPSESEVPTRENFSEKP